MFEKEIRSIDRFFLGVAAAVLTLICLIVRFCIVTYAVRKKRFSGSDVSYFISFIIQAITVMVVAVPEGLSLAVTLALAFAVRVRSQMNRIEAFDRFPILIENDDR